MNRIITICISLTLASICLLSQTPVINKSVSKFTGYSPITPVELKATPVSAINCYLPENSYEPVILTNAKSWITEPVSVISTDTAKYLLRENEYTYFAIDTREKIIVAEKKPENLSDESKQAILLTPIWMEDQLKLKLKLLHSLNTTVEKQYANLIINSPQHLRDEVGFVIANMSLQTLTDSRFIQDKQMIVRNAAFIYNVADSLQYVKLVESGDYNSRNYYTTTKYRVYDPVKKDTVWSEIPKEIYYWYIVHPKLDQEGVYVADNSNDASGQRTYGFSWRDFIWKNPDAAHDYRNVNITTSKGSVTTIPRFGELIKSARYLWDRNKTYFTFNRPFQSNNSALDIIGNWCSRALPVDVTLPRSFQPNQILMKHNGMCNEDAFLVAATCRTALIPIIYLGTWCEDHVFGSVYDVDWNHFEFFRGGLAESGNTFYGITNMLDRGSYGWKNSMVEGFRPDGYPINFSSYYANTCGLSVRAIDKNGNPVDGVKLTFFASPNAYNNNYTMCGNAFTNKDGYADIRAGEQKKYLVQAYHPKFGWSPADSTQAYVLTSSNSVANMIYRVNVPFANVVMPDISPAINPNQEQTSFTFNINLMTQDVLSGTNERDSQKSRFYLWGNNGKGSISLIVCDSLNFELFKAGQPFTAFENQKSVESADYNINIPGNTKWYVILSNQTSSIYYQNVKASCTLFDKIEGIDDKPNVESKLYPNPFNEILTINTEGDFRSIRIFDMLGNHVKSMNYPENKWTPGNIPAGIFSVIIDYGNKFRTLKAIYTGR